MVVVHVCAEHTAETLIDVLSLVSLDEGTSGLALHPVHSDFGFESPGQVAKVVPGFGLLDITALEAVGRSRVPKWAGTPAVGGDIYVDSSSPDRAAYIVVNSTSFTKLLPFGDVQRSVLERGLGHLEVSYDSRRA